MVKNPPANAGDARAVGSIPGSGRHPGRRNGNPLQFSSLENSMDRGAWRATVHGVAKSQTGLSTHVHHVPCTVPTVVKKTETVPAVKRVWPSQRDKHEIYIIMRQFCLI